MTKTTLHIWTAAVCAAAGAFLLAAETRFAMGTAQTVCLLAATPAAGWAGFVFLQQKDGRLRRIFAMLGGAAVLAYGLALRLDAAEHTGMAALAGCGLAAVCWAPAAGQLFIWMKNALQRMKKPVTLPPKKAFWLSFLLLTVCWLPVFAALFPGVTGYDMQSLVYQNVSGEYVNGHPIAHTLLVGAFLRLGEALFQDASLGVGIGTGVQMLCLAGAMAYALYWLSLRRCPAAVWTGILLLFALAPQHAIMANSITKDVLFAAVLLVLAVELCRWQTEPERAKCWRGRIWLALLVTAACLLRRNMILALLLMLAALLLRSVRRGVNRRLIAVMAAGIVLFLGSEAALKAAVGAEEPTVRDAMALPCQQLARVYALYGTDHPVGYEIRETLPFAENYTPERADQAKRQAKITTPEQLTGFLKLWLREALHYPVEYLDAFLYTSRAYWDLSDVSYAYTYDDEPYGPRGCLTVNNNPHAEIEMGHWFPALRSLLDRLYTDNEALNILPVRILIHPALYTWLLLFAAAWTVYERQKAGTAVLTCCAYLLTLLLGPCAIVRYSYYLMLCVPVLLGMLSGAKERKG